MRILDNIKISVKLPFALVALSAIALGVMGVFSYLDARNSLISAAKEKLSQTVAARASEIVLWEQNFYADILFQAQSPLIKGALRSFSGSWKSMEDQAGPYLRGVYIDQNEFAEDQRDQLIYPKDKSSYSRNHKKYHGYFRSLAQRNTYSDIYLFDAGGNMLYSVYKRDDFALTAAPQANELAGAQNPLLAIVSEILTQAQAGTVHRADFTNYVSAGGALSGFLAVAVTDAGGRVTGVLAYRIETTSLTQIMQRSVGLGEMGESYILSQELRYLSDVKSGDTHLSVSEDDPVLTGFNGQSGVHIVDRETPIAMAFTPLDVAGVNWVVAAQQPVHELLGPALLLRTSMAQKALVFLLIFGAVGLLIGRSVSRPLQKLSHAMAEIRDGNYQISLSELGRGDEIGESAASLDKLRQSLAEVEAAISESMFKSAAVEASSAALMVTDQDFRITHTNAAFRRIIDAWETELLKYFPDINSSGLVGKHIAGLQGIPKTLADLDSEPAPVHWNLSFGPCRMAIKICSIKSDNAQKSGEVVDEGEAAMAAILKSSNEIVKVISVIDEMAFQTHLLALNAGGEAARAGEVGRGFAVVATEVRALAQRCSDAAAEIGELITLSGSHATNGVDLVHQTGGALKRIVASVSDISDRMDGIAKSGQEQSMGLVDVNNVVTRIDRDTRNSVEVFLETSASSAALLSRAQSLEATIARFKVGGDQQNQELRDDQYQASYAVPRPKTEAHPIEMRN